MELKLSFKKRFFVKVSSDIKESLGVNECLMKTENLSSKDKMDFEEKDIIYERGASIEDYIVDGDNPTFSKLVKISLCSINSDCNSSVDLR